MDENDNQHHLDIIFNKWNEKKKDIHLRTIPSGIYFNEREIWWCSFGYNIGSEENGKHKNFERPILIFRKFGNEMIWAIPLTSRKIKESSQKEYPLFCNNQLRTLDICQMRNISSKRLLRYIETISLNDFHAIRHMFTALI